jgi:hypothetical protein
MPDPFVDAYKVEGDEGSDTIAVTEVASSPWLTDFQVTPPSVDRRTPAPVSPMKIVVPLVGSITMAFTIEKWSHPPWA